MTNRKFVGFKTVLLRLKMQIIQGETHVFPRSKIA